MQETERDLLVRIDERTESTHRWVLEHENKHMEETTARARWTIFILGTLTALGTKVIFWR